MSSLQTRQEHSLATLEIRPAKATEIPALAELELQVFQSVVYPEFFFRQARDLWPDYLLVALLDGHLVGYLLAAPGQQGLQQLGILSLAVSAQSRSHGVGKALMQHLLQQSPAVTRRWWLTVSPDNEVAVQLYQKLGFVSEQYYPDYYGPGEHRLVLARQLPALA